ncbi:unnamed protein product [Arabidopsis thaliana]|uniref:(thale cress) hypothetical protein n=1 Tax=Arabidopsis thaliana TaxID=3702 RepID=A0A7G2FI04_ARATH|nr:unnamed protein product [Arabidopsis thaliana]
MTPKKRRKPLCGVFLRSSKFARVFSLAVSDLRSDLLSPLAPAILFDRVEALSVDLAFQMSSSSLYQLDLKSEFLLCGFIPVYQNPMKSPETFQLRLILACEASGSTSNSCLY